jgi:hypothetical protein
MQLEDVPQFEGDFFQRPSKFQVGVGLTTFAVVLCGVAYGTSTRAQGEHPTTALRAVAPAPTLFRTPTGLGPHADLIIHSRPPRADTVTPQPNALQAQAAPAGILKLSKQPQPRMVGWVIAGSTMLVLPFLLALVRRIATLASPNSTRLGNNVIGSQWTMAAAEGKEYLFTFGDGSTTMKLLDETAEAAPAPDAEANETAEAAPTPDTEASDESALRATLAHKLQEMQSRQLAVEKMLREWRDDEDGDTLRDQLTEKWQEMQSRERAVEQLLQEWRGDDLQDELLKQWNEMQSREGAIEKILQDWHDDAETPKSESVPDASDLAALREDLMEKWQEIQSREFAFETLVQEWRDNDLRSELLRKWEEMQSRDRAIGKLLQEWTEYELDEATSGADTSLESLRANLLHKWEDMQSRQRAVERLLQEWGASVPMQGEDDLAALRTNLMQKWHEMQSRERTIERLLEEWRDNAFMQVSHTGSGAEALAALRQELLEQWQEVEDRERAIERLLQEWRDASDNE